MLSVSCVQVRTEVTGQCVAGKNWASVDGEYKSISVSGRGHVWAVDMTDRVWWRKGAKAESALGSGWKCIAGKDHSIGLCKKATEAAGPAINFYFFLTPFWSVHQHLMATLVPQG